MPSLWEFAGLTPLNVARRGLEKIGRDQLSNWSAALSYYFLLALFPMFLFLVSLAGLVVGQHSQLRQSITTGLLHLAPGSASELVQTVVNQTFKSSSGIKLAAGLLGALWAASGGMGAVITSLNQIYQAKEERPWWEQQITVIGLTLALAALIILALVLVLYGGKIGTGIANYVGLGPAFRLTWKIVQWPLTFFAMFLSYSIMYYFGPDLEERKWHWVTPGAALGVTLWLISSVGFRIYLHFFNSYSATYGSLGAVVILMLWLYITGFAILIGGELNWVIENEDKRRAAFEAKRRAVEQPAQAA